MKTKQLLLSLLALSTAIGANADSSLTIGSGNLKVSAPIDFYNTDSYQGAEIIYLDAEIIALRGKTITAIEFNYSNSNSSASPSLSFELRIGTTSSSRFSSTSNYLVNASSSSSRGNATISAPSGAGWITIPLDNPYTISSSWTRDNLVIDLRNVEKGGWQQNVSFLGTNVGGARTIRWYAASSSTSTNTGTLSDILPNVRFIFNDTESHEYTRDPVLFPKIETEVTSSLTGETGVTAITCYAIGQLKEAYINAGRPSKLQVKGIVSESEIDDVFDEDHGWLDYYDLSEAKISEGYISSTDFCYHDDVQATIVKFILPNTLQKINSLSRNAYIYSSSPYIIEELSGQLYVPSSSKSAWKAAVKRYIDHGIVLSSEPLRVKLSTAGTLQSTLGLSSWQYKDVEYLIIDGFSGDSNHGKMNSQDFRFLKNLTNLEILALDYIDIVEGKIPDNTFQNFKALRLFSFYQGSSRPVDIGNYAFDGCENLSSFDYFYYIKSIGDFAFRNTKIRDITLRSSKYYEDENTPDNIYGSDGEYLKSVGKNPFFGTPYGRKIMHSYGDYDDYYLFELKIYPDPAPWLDYDDYVQQILSQDEKTLYATFTAKRELTLCPNIETIQDYGLSSIGSSTVILNSKLKTLGQAFLYKCTNLTNIQISGNPYFKSEGGVLYNVGKMFLIKYPCAKEASTYCIPSSVVLIEDYAFEGASKLKSIRVDNTTPPTIFANTFEGIDKTSVKIYVPAGSKAAYEAADYWKEFKEIIEFIDGDVNGDEDVDVLDVVDIVRYVVDNPAETFVPILADINNNGEVNVGDAVALVNEIAGDQNLVKPWRAPKLDANSEDILTLNSTDNGMSLCMQNERNYTAFQLDLYLPEGTDASDMLLNIQRKQGHQLIYNKVEEGHYRVAAISTSNSTFGGYEGELLAVGIEGIASEDICLRNIRFFTADGEEHLFDDIVMQSGTATDIASPRQSSYGDEAIYNLAGQRIQKTQKGINIVNGKKIAF